MTDGCSDAGGSSSPAGVGCSVSTGHLSTLGDNSSGAAGSHNKKKIPFGGSDQGINSSVHRKTSGNIARGTSRSAANGHQTGVINHKKNGEEGSKVNHEDPVNGLSATRQFHSLPRMSSTSGELSLFSPASSSSPSAVARALGLATKGKRSFNPEFDKESKTIFSIIYLFTYLSQEII